MNRELRTTLFLLALPLAACSTTPDYGRALPPGAPALIPLEDDEELPDFAADWETRYEILPAIDLSIDWINRGHAPQFFPQSGISHERTLRSLERFRALLLETTSAREFQDAIEREFQVYVSAGWDGRGGGVLFTGYCTPELSGSLEPGPGYEHPLYALPPDLVKASDGSVVGWETSFGMMPEYPSRGAIEAGHLLDGRDLELVWLRDPIDAYIAHVNGSAFVRLPDGSLYRLGYAGKNGREYTSLGRELMDAGKIERGKASLATIREWAARASEQEVHDFLSRNASFVFFTPIDGNPHGSLDVEVTSGRSIATDKRLFPRGAVVFVESEEGEKRGDPVGRFYLDQDTGGAIRTAGRADLYVGIGDEAEQVAGSLQLEGQMYYLFLR